MTPGTGPLPGTFERLRREQPTTLDAEGVTLRWLDTVESTERPGHRATVGPVYADGTFDVCDIDIGLFGRQEPRQWRKVSGTSDTRTAERK